MELTKLRRRNLDLEERLRGAQERLADRLERESRADRGGRWRFCLSCTVGWTRQLSPNFSCDGGGDLSVAMPTMLCRAVEARRWEQAVEAQADSIAQLRVDAEQDRRRQQTLLNQLTSREQAAAEQEEDVAALLRRLAAVEACAAAAEGEAAALRRQLAAAEAEAAEGRAEVAGLQEELGAVRARLQASELVRREVEADKEAALLSLERLQAALQSAEGTTTCQALAAERALASAHQELAVERQRGEMLANQLRASEDAAAETERLLHQQLWVVQQERTACLTAATRADALLVKLGAHALLVKGDAQLGR